MNPQQGATDEFLYAPRANEFNLRIWHHPFGEYLSVQSLEKHSALDEANLRQSLPEEFRLREYPKSTYLEAPTQKIDMSADICVERTHVEEGMEVARRAIDSPDAAARSQVVGDSKALPLADGAGPLPWKEVHAALAKPRIAEQDKTARSRRPSHTIDITRS